MPPKVNIIYSSSVIFLSLFCFWSMAGSFFDPPHTKFIQHIPDHRPEIIRDSFIYSFAFIGCNRVDQKDLYNPMATDSSTANRYVLKRIFDEVAEEKPNALFLLGDIVFGLRSTHELDRELYHWKKNLEAPQFSKLSDSEVEIILVPGNHEQLYYKDVGIKGHYEWPLKGAQTTWIKHLGGYLPKDRDYISGKDSIDQQSTFSFVRQNSAFVVINTDTYIASTPENPYGLEGQIPLEWINKKIESYRQDPRVEHIFVLGHKPYYIFDIPFTGHLGLPQGKELWETIKKNRVIAMLSAHFHAYQRMHPSINGPYQIIAGNGGSSGPATFFGYTLVKIMSSRQIRLISKGFDKGRPYYTSIPNNPTKIRDSTVLRWRVNHNPYFNLLHLDYKEISHEVLMEIEAVLRKID